MIQRTLLAALAVLGLAGPAPAQDTTTPPAAPAETPPVPAQPNELDKEFPIAEEEKPREVLKATFDAWEVRCAASDESRCFLYQLAKDKEGRPLAEITLLRLPDGGQAAAGVTVVTSLGVFLPKGVTVTVDAGQPIQHPFQFCAQTGCFSRFGLTGAFVTRMKKGAQAKVTLFGVNAPDRAVEGFLSLKGFTAAYDSVQPLK